LSQREDVLIVIVAINSGCLPPRELELVGLENGDAVCVPEGRADVQDVSVMFKTGFRSEFFTSE
jgi:hypothetical protein